MKHLHPLVQLLLAQLHEFYREPAVLFWVYGFPLFLAIGLGIAFSGGSPTTPGSDALEVDIEKTQDSTESTALLERLHAEGIDARLVSPEECLHHLRTGKTSLCIVPWASSYRYVYDPARPDALIARYRVDDVVQRWKSGQSAWPTEDSLMTEPGNRYIDFLIPGLMGLNLMGGGLWGVGFVIVDMRVRKLLKRFLATPMRKSDFLLSILASRLVFMVPEMLVLVLVGVLAFGTPVRGNPLTLMLVIVVGGATFSGLGLLLASRTEQTETVSGLINLIMLPMWMLSGTFFTSRRFPEAIQPVIQAFPLTQLNDALREVMLEGASLQAVSWRLLVLAGWTLVPFLLALKWFRWL
jgi:ABC-2 type transport system permease protein